MSLDDVPDPLEPAAREADAALCALERDIDWLAYLSPTGNAARWEGFVASGHRLSPPLTYPPLPDLPSLRERLARTPADKVAHPVIGTLLREKAAEIGLQIDLLERRGKDGFAAVSAALFGAPRPALLAAAERILADVEDDPAVPDTDADDFAAAARAMRRRLEARAPGFDFGIAIRPDLQAMMIHRGDLAIPSDMRLPRARIAPLLAHEVGVHVVTRHNGRRQPLHLLEWGLAHYDALQEGLATLAEYLAGYLPPVRLRTLAARVIAADMATRGEGVEAIFARLHEGHALPAERAFDTAVRALRGGGLTKDAVYLDGLVELLAHLAAGGTVEPLMAGKIALRHRPLMETLAEEGLLAPPALLPDHLLGPRARARLDRARGMGVAELFQTHPEPGDAP